MIRIQSMGTLPETGKLRCETCKRRCGTGHTHLRDGVPHVQRVRREELLAATCTGTGAFGHSFHNQQAPPAARSKARLPEPRLFSKFSAVWWLEKQFHSRQTNGGHETASYRAPSLSQIDGR